jgi:hypothetical protein
VLLDARRDLGHRLTTYPFIAHVPGTAITLAAGTAGLTVASEGQVYDVPLLEQAGS